MVQCVFHDTGPAARDRRLFDLVESAYHAREPVVVFTRGDERAQAIDRLLWILRQEAFIPHRIVGQHEEAAEVPVVIVTSEIDPNGAGILIADAHCGMDFAAAFGTVHEFVDRSSAEMHQSCRDRFRAYKDRGVPVEYRK